MIKNKNIIDGKAIANLILADLKSQVEKYHNLYNLRAKLAIIQVGDDIASTIYIRNKIKAAEDVGILAELRKFEANISLQNLLTNINELNLDPNISGIIIQLPLPDHIDKLSIISAVNPQKDVDGFHPVNVGLLYSGYGEHFIPCTARGGLDLIKSCEPNLSGKNIVVIGRSNLVGRPLAALLLKEDCTVTICHSKTKNLSLITSQADIVISAVGKPLFLTKDYFKEEAIVIDVGINRIEREGRFMIVGDVDFEDVKDKVKFITRVPGGVGPMTIAHLLKNTHSAMLLASKINN